MFPVRAANRAISPVLWRDPYPRVGFLVTNLCRPPERVVAFYNQHGTAEQWIKEGKNAVRWTRLSCRSMKANAVRLQPLATRCSRWPRWRCRVICSVVS